MGFKLFNSESYFIIAKKEFPCITYLLYFRGRHVDTHYHLHQQQQHQQRRARYPGTKQQQRQQRDDCSSNNRWLR